MTVSPSGCPERPAPASDTAAPQPLRAAPPPRPTPAQERWALRLFSALAPRTGSAAPPPPPERLAPWENVSVPRPDRGGHLSATWYPLPGPGEGTAGTADSTTSPTTAARGAVLLLPPWLEWGRTYFHRRRRLERLRAAGYHALTVDLPGFGDSGPARGFYDRDVTDALAELARRAPDLPLFLWGVSSGGYWSHMALSGDAGRRATGGRPVRAAMFEDVSPHLIEWASHTTPVGRPFHYLFRTLFPVAFRFMDLRLHASALPLDAVAYVSGEADPGIPPGDTRELAQRAGGEAVVVPGVGHLQAIKRANDRVLDLALETFEEAVEPRP